MKKNAKNHCNIEGQWTKYLDFQNERYWDKAEYPLANYYKDSNYILPSDSTLREDLNYFINNDEINAQIWKEKLEDQQRNDRKFREKEIKKKVIIYFNSKIYFLINYYFSQF